MGFIGQIKDNIKKEISAFKYNRELENDPDVVKNRLNIERAKVQVQKDQLLTKQQLEQDKRELQTLKNSTGIRGQIKSGLGSLRGYLDDVKKKNGSKNFKLKNPTQERSQSVFDIKGSGSSITSSNPRGMHSGSSGSYRPFGSGVLNSGSESKPKKKKQSKQIIINL